MAIPVAAALWFLPFVLPICFYVAFTDLREMKIKNQAVVALAVVYVVVGLVVFPPWNGDWPSGMIGPFPVALPVYVWQLMHLFVVLLIGIILNAAGAVGAGDAKFSAAAAPFIWTADFRLLLAVLMATLLAAFAAHRIAKFTPLRRIAPDWKSWDAGKAFPMGLTLGGCLAIYLILGAFFGS
ncbi:MAG: prepilin peptidase [Ruegeria sp.]